MRQRLSIFIDGSNFYHSLKDVHSKVDLDFGHFVNMFSDSNIGPRVLNPVRYYNSVVDQGRYPITYVSQQRFFAHLQKLQNPPFVIIRGRIEHHGVLKYRCRGCERVQDVSIQKCPVCSNIEILQDSQEKGIDVSIAVDMVSGAFRNEYDTCLLVSEDSDFIPAIRIIQDLGKRVELATLTSKTRRRGYHLIQAVNWTHYVKPGDIQWIRP